MRSTAWLIWLGACAVVLWTTRNPLYLVLALLCVEWVRTTLARLNPQRDSALLATWPISPLRLIGFIVPVSALLNALWTRAGDTVLFRLPSWLPLIGGAVTVEALAYGAISGLVLSGFIMAFSVLNQALSVRALINLIPRAFHPLAVIVSIAVTYVPFTLRQIQAIGESQRIRGHELRRVRDWLPLFMPLLAGGLERALQLAEAITARGFAHPNAGNLKLEALTLLGVLLAAVGWLSRLLWFDQPRFGWAVLLTGIALTTVAVWRLGARTPRTRYRPERWTARDGVMIGFAVVAVLGVSINVPELVAGLMPGLNRLTLFYDPYPALTLPLFDPWIGLCILGLAAPALLLAHDRNG